MFDGAHAWIFMLSDASLKAVLLAFVAALGLTAFRVKNSHVRHRVWTAVLIGMLGMPVLSQLVPSLAIPIPTSKTAGIGQPSDDAESRAVLQLEETKPEAALPSRPKRAAKHSALASLPANHPHPSSKLKQTPGDSVDQCEQPTLQSASGNHTPALISTWPSKATVWNVTATLLCASYALVTTLLMLRLVVGTFRTARLVNASRRVVSVKDVLDETAGSWLGDVAVRENDRVRVPVAIGWLQPSILLPADWPSWGRDKLQSVMQHESAHIARRDCLVNLLAELNRCVYWFHPLAWKLVRWLSDLAELNCDDAVIIATGSRASYARHLLEIATTLVGSNGRALQTSASMARSANVATRIDSILDDDRPLSRRIGWRGTFCLVAIILPAILVSAAVTAGTQGDAASTNAATAEEPGTAQAATSESAQSNTNPQVQEPSPAKQPASPLTYKGRVVGPDGNPVGGANVYFVIYDVEAYPSGKPITKTKQDGSFEFEIDRNATEDVPAQRWESASILADSDGFGGDSALAMSFETSGAFADELKLLLPRIAVMLSTDQTLKLVADTTPVNGRVVDLEGRPIRGVTIKLLQIRAAQDDNLDPFVEGLKSAREARNLEFQHLPKSIPSAKEMFPPVTTDDAGRFSIEGIGRDRLVTLRMDGPGIESQVINVITRNHKRTELPDYKGTPDWITIYYGANFDHPAAPSKPVVGIVRDKDTGKPLAGVTLRGEPSLHGSSFVQWVETTTDAEGRYELVGLPSSPQNRILAIPPDDQPYLLSQLRPQRTAGLAPVKLDFNLKRGVWIEGQVTDKNTGEPVRAAVFYSVFTDNPEYREAPGLNGAHRGWIVAYYIAEDGKFRRVGLPGRGLITVRAMDNRYLMGVGAEDIQGGDERAMRPTFRTAPQIVFARNFHTLAEVNIPESAEVIRKDLTVDPGRSFAGTLVDPEGEPVSGARFCGKDAFVSWAHEPLPTANFTVSAFDSAEPRLMQFYHEEKKLIGHLGLRGDTADAFKVQLYSWSSVTGRLVDSEGKPLTDVFVHAVFDHKDLTLGQLPPTGNDSNSGSYYTDKDGHFRIEGLDPGLAYNLAVSEHDKQGFRRQIGVIATGLRIQGGETRDLGDVQPEQVDN